MTLSNNNEMKELEAEIKYILTERQAFTIHILSRAGNESAIITDVEQIMTDEIITLCRTHFGKMWWEKIEDKLSDCYGKERDDIKRILMGRGMNERVEV